MKLLFEKLLVLFFVLIFCELHAKTVTPRKIYNTCAHNYNYHRCDVLTAMAFVESRFKTNEFNPKEMAFGLFQMRCYDKTGAARSAGLKFSCKQLFSLKVAVRFAVKFLELLDPTDALTDKELIAAWNANKVEYCTEFREYRWGVCYPNELKNEDHVLKVYRHLKYIRRYQLLNWLT